MLIDSHIHFDKLNEREQNAILEDPNIEGIVALAMDLQGCKTLLQLKQRYTNKLKIAAGFHPEQVLLTANEQDDLFDWMMRHKWALDAVGEVGLPHYSKRENPALDYAPYLKLLERFVAFSKQANLPLNLHIVHDDVCLALDLLEKYGIPQAHFHWFKTDEVSLAHFLATPYFASLTPDILWNPKTQRVAERMPLARLMIETDSPWPHEGCENMPISMQLQLVIKKLAEIKHLSESETKMAILENTKTFYRWK